MLLSNRSGAKLGGGDAEGALADALKCVEIKKDFARGHARVGSAAYKLTDYLQAVRSFKEACKCEPGNGKYQTDLAEAEKMLAVRSFARGEQVALTCRSLPTNCSAREFTERVSGILRATLQAARAHAAAAAGGDTAGGGSGGGAAVVSEEDLAVQNLAPRRPASLPPPPCS